MKRRYASIMPPSQFFGIALLLIYLILNDVLSILISPSMFDMAGLTAPERLE